jgi:hypothetical protein
LTDADKHLEVAKKSLKRSVPYHKLWIANLLRRNYYQVADSERLYAVASLDDKGVSGGTAWAVQMFLDIHGPECEAYIYNQLDSHWYSWTDLGWVRIDQPPQPHGIWTGVGSRALLDNGKAAIRTLMNWTKPEVIPGAE